MKKIACQIVILAVVLLLICMSIRQIMGNAYTSFIPIPRSEEGTQSFHAISDRPEYLRPGTPEIHHSFASVKLQPQRRGNVSLSIVDETGKEIAVRSYWVGPFMTVYDPSTGGFTGDSILMLAFTAFCFAVAFLMLRWFKNVKWTEFYSYGTIYAAGFSAFALLTGVFMAYVTIRHIAYPRDYSMLNAYKEISQASWRFMVMMSPLLFSFAAAITVSNIALLRHEKPCPQNVLGVSAGVILIVGEALAWLMYGQNSRPVGRLFEALRGIYATVFVYFECMLLGSITCGLKAAKHKPQYDRDYIIILGCRFRKDGTLTPLLKGRVDSAITFWRAQKAATGKEAVLVPSGGQGDGEVMSEAEAMSRYLILQGIPQEAIRIEDKSHNTYQNMEFSRNLIDDAEAKVAYATTNYHVFRSGVWASLAGLPAEGIGSQTKWWYWPNAFMRECLGLLRNRWKQEIAGMILLVTFFVALSAAIS